MVRRMATDKKITMKTSKGDINLTVFASKTPMTAASFLNLASKGFYNGLTFHRVIADFMIQGGDPTATGCGGESIWGHNFKDEFCRELHNLRGALSMANAGPGTNGSQFFIVQAKTVPEQMVPQMEALIGRGFTEDSVDDYKAFYEKATSGTLSSAERDAFDRKWGG